MCPHLNFCLAGNVRLYHLSPKPSKATNAERNAKVVVHVKDSEDVVKSIAYAKDHKLPIAIRGGGHNAAGASSVEGGLKKLGYVGGGAIWAQVDQEAIKYGLATVGGTVNHVCQPDPLPHCGYGWLAGRHGLTIDNLKQRSAESNPITRRPVVTANGSILTANDTENSDLFWAIRGGGSNFGVATELVYQLHPQRKTVFGGSAVYTPDKVEKLVELTKKWWDDVGEDEGMIQAVAASPDGKPVFLIIFFYNGSEEEGRAHYKEFFDVGPVVDNVREIPYEQLNSLQNPQTGHGRCYYLKGVSQAFPDPKATMELIQKVAEIAKGGVFKPAMLHEYFSLGKANSVPVSATAFRRQVSSNILTNVAWEPEEGVDKTAEAREIAKELVDIKSGYTNYGHDDIDIPSASIASPTGDHGAKRADLAYASNYPKLQKIKKTYDPENVFNRWYPITPA
ncbi:FAD binding domain-containing protein [Ephemerocybe angulata]|uniref:FAD binding domain-containing protein n=1 Tax=Ephemerocybe angulata TaxID=980116 RepID=A0A8H6MA26_9AGAR|nr:FAD binding domain-containing protein [Tulosesus angulatus]